MRKIFKYPIEIIDIQIIKLPIGAKILTVQLQYEKPVLYALINPDSIEADAENKIYIFGTSHAIQNHDQLIYLNTIQQMGGSLVWHIFREK